MPRRLGIWSGVQPGPRMPVSATVSSSPKQRLTRIAYEASLAKLFAGKAAVENANLGVQGTLGVVPR